MEGNPGEAVPLERIVERTPSELAVKEKDTRRTDAAERRKHLPGSCRTFGCINFDSDRGVRISELEILEISKQKHAFAMRPILTASSSRIETRVV